MPKPPTSFQRHISFLNISRDGTITPYQSLKALLSLGFDFPVALLSALSLPILYGNKGFLRSKIEISEIPIGKQPTQLEDVSLDRERYSRRELLELSNAQRRGGGMMMGWVDKVHLLGVWVMAAGTRGEGRGFVKRSDVEAFRDGVLMSGLMARRRDRSQVLPLWRGGPISVAGHSWFVKKLFGVEVYQKNVDR